VVSPIYWSLQGEIDLDGPTESNPEATCNKRLQWLGKAGREGWHPSSIGRRVILTILRLRTTSSRSADLVQALRLLTRAARAEKGFITCQTYLDADDPNAITYEERWQTREDFEDQVRSPRYSRLLALMESALEQPSLEFHFVSRTRGLEYVGEVRGEDVNLGL